MRNPRINITLNQSDVEVMQLLCEKKQMSMSSLAKKMIEEWLEDYEDMLLAGRAEEAEERTTPGTAISFDGVNMKIRAVLLICLFTVSALAIGTSHWTHTSEADFKAGTFHNVVATNLGDLKLSRAVNTILGQDEHVSAVHALVEAPDGTIYAGTGPEGVLLAVKDDTSDRESARRAGSRRRRVTQFARRIGARRDQGAARGLEPFLGRRH